MAALDVIINPSGAISGGRRAENALDRAIENTAISKGLKGQQL